MSASIEAFYAAYLTGEAGTNLAMLALRRQKVVGTDLAGVRIVGSYRALIIRRYGHGPYSVGVAAERVELAADLELPHLERSV
jgi:hypothetical protein